MDPEIVTEIPEVLKKLVRLIVRGFYSLDHTIVIDLLVRNPCMKEDDIIDLLKFDKKQLRALVTVLKNDKFLKVRMRIETDDEGRNTRHNYYFINYQVFVNMVKYRLDHMRRKIEMEERDNTSRASFKCLTCEKSFTDLEADQLFDFMTGTFLCTYCKTEVVEDESCVATTDARTLLMQYNEQIQPVYDLLRDCEDIKLAPQLLEPEPTDLRHIRTDKTPTQRNERSGWSGEATKNTSFGYAERTVTVSVGEDTSAKDAANLAKETPVWMKESTVEGATAVIQVETPTTTLPSLGSPTANIDIMKTLLAHEKKPPKAAHKARVGGTSDDGSSTSEDDDDMPKKPTKPTIPDFLATSSHMTVDEGSEEEEEVAMVTIGERSIPYNDVTSDDVALMTQEEKDTYIQIGQEYYASMYE